MILVDKLGSVPAIHPADVLPAVDNTFLSGEEVNVFMVVKTADGRRYDLKRKGLFIRLR